MNIYGTDYETAAEILARMGELTLANIIHGESDDRVTEIRMLADGLMQVTGDPDMAQLVARNVRNSVSWVEDQVLSIEQEVNISRSVMEARYNYKPRGGWHNAL